MIKNQNLEVQQSYLRVIASRHLSVLPQCFQIWAIIVRTHLEQQCGLHKSSKKGRESIFCIVNAK